MLNINIDDIYKKSNLDWLKINTIYITLHGSHAYGTNRPESDIDLRGIAIPPKKYYLGVLDNFEQAIFSDPYDITIFDINKFIKLSLDNNPNCLELLFTDESDHLFKNEIMGSLLDIRDEFISKKIRHTFAGYAHSQLKRINLHRRWILNPPKGKPSRKDFELPESHKLIPESQLLQIEAEIQKRLDSWKPDTTGMERDASIKFKNDLYDILKDMRLNHDDMHIYAARSLGLNDNLMEAFKKERRYKTALREWKNYLEWQTNRNRDRYELEAKYQFDCYVDETEFLTQDGWKSFDDITENDLLATVDIDNDPSNRINGSKFRKKLSVVYQKYTERFDGTFSGNLYNLLGYHTDVLVTPNHRMLIRKVSRLKNKPNEAFDKLELREISNLYDCFDIVRQITPKTKNYCVKQYFPENIKPLDYLRLMGWFLADGTVVFSKGDPKAINISQADNGKLIDRMKRFNNKYEKASMYRYLRKVGGFRSTEDYENILSVRDSDVVTSLFNDCGSTKDKRIPRWVFTLSRQMMDTLLMALMGGDGTFRGDNSMIYYSSLKGLADDVQELALLCGYETSLYGPYSHKDNLTMYQVHVNKTREQFKRFVRSSAIRTVPVKNRRIVCFTVPNGTLITRYNGHVGIHGNSKHGMHLVRLYRQCKEALSSGKLNVKRPDAEELLAIRNGAWTYDQLIEWAEKQDAELDELYKTSTIRKEPNRKKINEWLINTISSYIGI